MQQISFIIMQPIFAPPPAAAKAAASLKSLKQRILVIEATTAGLLASSLVSQPGASGFFISSSVVYTGRGAKQLIPASVLHSTGLFDRDSNYRSKDPYVASKVKFCTTLATEMRRHVKADWVLVESGTSGPEFYIPGVESGFTAVAVSGPAGQFVSRVYHSSSQDRTANMNAFAHFALDCLNEALALPPAAKL